jgi:hypothetical protein
VIKEGTRRTVAVLVGALVASLLACGILAYLWIDRAVTLTYAEAGSRCTAELRGSFRQAQALDVLRQWQR